jgi:pseudouridine synthase
MISTTMRARGCWSLVTNRSYRNRTSSLLLRTVRYEIGHTPLPCTTFSRDGTGACRTLCSAASTSSDNSKHDNQHNNTSSENVSNSNSSSKNQQQTIAPQQGMRWSQIVAQAACVSRREAERLIRAGSVTVGGQAWTSPMRLVTVADRAQLQQAQYDIRVNGKSVPVRHLIRNMELNINSTTVATDDSTSQSTASSNVLATTNTSTQQSTPLAIKNDNDIRVWMVHKLKGEIVTERDPLNRPSVLDRLRRQGIGKSTRKGAHKWHIKAIGRLDLSTEGLLLVTNHGPFARSMELPCHEIHRVYRVRAHGLVTPHKIHRIRSGLTVDGVHYPGMQIVVEDQRVRRAKIGKFVVSWNIWDVRVCIFLCMIVCCFFIVVSNGNVAIVVWDFRSIPPGNTIGCLSPCLCSCL